MEATPSADTAPNVLVAIHTFLCGDAVEACVTALTLICPIKVRMGCRERLPCPRARREGEGQHSCEESEQDT